MRVFHILDTLVFGDGVGNDARGMNTVLYEMGWRSRFFASVGGPSFFEAGVVEKIENLPPVYADDIVIYHFSISCQLDYLIKELPCKKIMIFHNVTWPTFFKPYNNKIYQITKTTPQHLALLKDSFDYCLATSEFTKQDLLAAGYTCPIDILPVIIPFEDYTQKPDALIRNFYADDKTNILFTGRIAPHKKQENIIRAFSVYKRLYDPSARLFLVGGYNKEDTYYQSLLQYIQKIGVQDVIFSGHISFSEILAYFSIADLFVSMSEHEGFGIPLLEAMHFNIPVLAYDAAAVPDTLGGAGVLLKTNNPYYAAAAMDKLQSNHLFRQEILQGQQHRLQDFSYEKITNQFKQYFTAFVERVQ